MTPPGKLLLGLLTFLLVVLVYYPAIFAGILPADDVNLFTYLYNLEDYSLRDVFIRGKSYYYRPLLRLTYLADKELWGPHESFMHLENILLHAGSSILVFLIAHQLVLRYRLESRWLPLVAGLGFGLHPLTTESVNWISGRSDLLAGFFLFASLLCLLKALAGHSRLAWAGAAVTYVLAVLSKEVAFSAFPAALFLIYCWRREDGLLPERIVWKRLWPYLLAIALPLGYLLLRFLAMRQHDGGIDLALKAIMAGDYDLLDKGRVILKVFGFYCVKLVQPFPLNFAIVSASDWYVVPGVLGLLGCLWLFWRRSVLGALLLFSAWIVAPALLVPLGRMAWTPLAERYLYLPVAFAVVVAVIAGSSLLRRVPKAAVLTPLLVFLLLGGSAWATWQRTLVWQSNITLYADAVEKSPNFVTVRKDYAQELEKAGRIEEALKVYETFPAPEGERYSIVAELSRARARAVLRHDYPGAIAQLEALGHRPGQSMYKDYLKLLLMMYHQHGKTVTDDAAQKALNGKILARTIELQRLTGDAELLYRLGQLYQTAGDKRQAIDYYEQAARRPGPQQRNAEKLAARLRADQGAEP